MYAHPLRSPAHTHPHTHSHTHTHAPTTTSSGNGDVVHSERMARALLVLERLVGQNAEDEVFHDCKYWDDPSDAVKVIGNGVLVGWLGGCMGCSSWGRDGGPMRRAVWLGNRVCWHCAQHKRLCSTLPPNIQCTKPTGAGLPPPALAVRHRAHAAAPGTYGPSAYIHLSAGLLTSASSPYGIHLPTTPATPPFTTCLTTRMP